MVRYIRKKKTITDLTETPNKVTVFESINKAKRESRRLQMLDDGALGLGCLKVEK